MDRASFTQHGIILTERLASGTAAYHMPIVITFDGPPDVGALAWACDAVVERHPLLAARFEERDGETYVAAATRPALEVAPQRAPADEAARPFELETGPSARFVLCKDSTLVITVHHAVFDGHSKDILVRDLAAAYRGDELESAPAGTDFADFARGEPERVDDGLEAAAKFWSEDPIGELDVTVGGLTLTSRLPAAGHVVEFELPAAQVVGATRFESVLALLHAALWQHGNAVPVTAVAMSIRTDDLADTIGPFVHEHPVDSRPADGASFEELTLDLRGRLRGISEHRHVPYCRAVPTAWPYASAAPVSISYRRLRHSPEDDFGAVRAHTDRTYFNGAVRGELQLQVVDDGATLRASLRSSNTAAPIAEEFAVQLQKLAGLVADDPAVALSALPKPDFTARPTASDESTEASAAPTETAAESGPGDAGADAELLRQVREIWEEILGKNPIGDEDDLFDLGGHSLTVTKIIARMRSALDVDIPLGAFFDDPTIAGVVRVAGARR
jgi:acyl carrier protein